MSSKGNVVCSPGVSASAFMPSMDALTASKSSSTRKAPSMI